LRILVAGVGNILRGDDGLGPYVVRSLVEEGYRVEGVELMDYGERLYDLMLVMGSYDAVIVVDAVDVGGDPGSLYLIEPGKDEVPRGSIDLHGVSLGDIVALAGRLGMLPGRLYIVGCQPLSVGMGVGLSPVVTDCAERAKAKVKELVEKIMGGG